VPAGATVPAPTNAGAVLAAKAAEPEKPGMLQKLNPANLFRGKQPKPTTTLPSKNSPGRAATNSVVAVASAAPPAPPATPPIPPRPPIARYAYQSPAKPPPGRRAEAQVSFARALEAHRAGKTPEALADYREATRLDPSFFEAHYNLGLAAYQTGQTMSALAAYEMALAVDPGSVSARYNFALALQQGQFHRDAARELEGVLAARPQEVRAHLTLANLYAQQLFDYPKAKAHYREVLRLEPQHPEAPAIRYWLTTHP
jgi:hypothetical protein